MDNAIRTSGIAQAVRKVQAAVTQLPERERSRLMRQCEVVERYDVRGESRESICRRLRISSRTFYLDRRALLSRISTFNSGKRASPSDAIVRSPLAVRFQEAELLIQVGAHDLAERRLTEIAANASDENDRIAALGRLVNVECNAGRLDVARQALANAHERARVSESTIRDRARGAILAAEACYGFSQRDAPTLVRCTDALEQLATQSLDDSQLWSDAATAWAQASYYRYLRQEIGAAESACRRSEAALERARDARPKERASVLALRAEIDRYDPMRVHRAGEEDADAYRLAVEHGMVESACVALHNTLMALLLSDEAIDDDSAWIAGEIARAACELATPASGTMITAVALAILQRYDDAIALLAQCDYHQGRFDWSAVHRMLQARIFFKARRFHAAERAARIAFQQWDRSGPAGQGKALRIRAESLEALGERRSAAQVIGEALEALRPCAPVYHLLAAYRCAARVAPRPAYRDEIDSLTRALHRQPALARWTDVLVQTAKSPVARSLTKRQREIARLVADGKTNAAIARKLGISTKTVANHVAAVFECLGLRARWQLTHVILSGATSPHVILSGATSPHVILSGASEASAVEGRRTNG